mmetsp:Transcript_35284/g.113444  ORF Transcript_35284/g.113444 Transcript_35284/m.113444 type:complete len:113 (-) Transcript_35284:299-637(-)
MRRQAQTAPPQTAQLRRTPRRLAPPSREPCLSRSPSPSAVGPCRATPRAPSASRPLRLVPPPQALLFDEGSYNASLTASWVLIGTDWLCSLLYCWTLIAPRLCPSRDFGVEL